MTEDESKMDALAALYARIPSVDCIPGCTDCCGPIPVNREEARHFGPFPLVGDQGIALSASLDCPNSSGGNCRIHDRRPFICRLFGTVDQLEVADAERRMACPHGRKPSKPLTGAQVRALMVEYLELSGARAT